MVNKYTEWLKPCLLVLLYVAQLCGKCTLYKMSKNAEKCQGHFRVSNEGKPGLEWRNRMQRSWPHSAFEAKPLHYLIVIKANIFVWLFSDVNCVINCVNSANISLVNIYWVLTMPGNVLHVLHVSVHIIHTTLILGRSLCCWRCWGSEQCSQEWVDMDIKSMLSGFGAYIFNHFTDFWC